MDGYQRDVAYIHDRGFGFFARETAPGLLRLLRRAGVKAGLVVELGCGSGIWAEALTKTGYDVTGVDISPDMIRLARKAAPKAKFVTGSLLSVEIPPCDAVVSTGECVNYCFDPSNNLRTIARLFRRIHRALNPGGVFVFDFAEPGQLAHRTSPRGHWYGDDWAILLELEEDTRRNILTRHLTGFRRHGRLYRRTDEVHRLRLYAREDLAAELHKTGFGVQLLAGYGRLRVPAGHAVILARKPRETSPRDTIGVP
jgi:SAM-dependent methyltransferase